MDAGSIASASLRVSGLWICVRILTAVLPLALTPILLKALAEGDIDLGGGETDLVWILPWVLWSLVFAVSALCLWRRGRLISRSLLSSALIGLAALVIVAAILAALGQLGVGGRF